MRSACLVMLLALSGTAAAQVTGAIAPTPALKGEVTVTSELVRIGDLIENAGRNTNTPVFRAPDLGQTGTVQVSRVIDAVRAHGLIIVDTRGLTEVAVTRASRVIPLKEIEVRIARAVTDQYGYSDVNNLLVSFDREARPIRVEATAAGELQITRLFFDPRSGRFDASFDLPGSAVARRLTLRYTGSIVETVAAAVLARSLNRGEVIKAADVAIERRPKAEVGLEVISAATQAVGLAVRRPLRAGQPLRAADLMKPELVQRNEPVTLVYEAPGMMLTIRGKALESGAEGDIVSVLNIQSKRTVQGTITGPGRITVAATTPLVASVAPPEPQPAGEPPRSE